MLSLLRHHLRANVVAYLALVVALGGTSYAAVQLQPGQVKTTHLANGAVTGKKIKNKSVRRVDLAPDVQRGQVLAAHRAGTPLPALPNFVPQAVVITPTDFTVKRAGGSLFVRAFASGLGYVCAGGGESAAVLVLDGAMVPGSQIEVANTESEPLRPVEIVAKIPAAKGSHTGYIGLYCVSGVGIGPTATPPYSFSVLQFDR